MEVEETGVFDDSELKDEEMEEELELGREVDIVGAETGHVVTPTEVTIVIVLVWPAVITVDEDVA